MDQVARRSRQTLRRALVVSVVAGACAHSAFGAPRVLQVGSLHGDAGHYATIQAAVNDARPGDWILIGPGDYHENGGVDAEGAQVGVLITTPGIHLRGMDRNHVVVDGTVPGAATCSAVPADQDVQAGGRNGIEILMVDGVSVENLTVCNFLGDPFGNQGNQIWWNGGDGSGVIGMGAYHGAYLTATSTYFDPSNPPLPNVAQNAQYGVFASNSRGPGLIEYTYASNMADSSFYVGACPDCNAVLNYVHAQNSAQGYSGSNSGGHLVLQNSEWDHNQAGIVPSSLAVFDLPSPQNGACPSNPGKSCTLIQYNLVHDNNNPNTPASGLAATVPVGTGIELTGGINNTVQYNVVTNNGSWGILLNDFADYSAELYGVANAPCTGGQANFTPVSPYDQLYEAPPAPGIPGLPIPCYFSSFGNRIMGNVMYGNGLFGNPTNGDLANAALPYPTNNCFSGNNHLNGGKPTSSPHNLQDPSVAGVCGQPWNPNTRQEFELTAELGCASLGLCTGLPGPGYPVRTTVRMFPNPHDPGMTDACAGVPENSWCPE